MINTTRTPTVAKAVPPDRLDGYEDDAAFLAFVKSNLDPEWFKKVHGDIAAAGVDPLEHWLYHGLYEGRSMGVGVLVVRSKTPYKVLGDNWRRFVWRGDYIAVRLAPVSSSVRRQIIDQARHEPAVLPPNGLSIDCLPWAYRPELLNRDGVDVESILTYISARPKIVIVLPNLQVCEATKFAAGVTDVLVRRGGSPALVLLTEQTAEQASGWEKLPNLSSFRGINLVFWRDVCGRSHNQARMFAILLNVLRPRHIVVVDSYLGFDAIACYGKGLSYTARLYCTALNGSSVAMKFIRRILPFAVVLADSESTAAKLRGLYGGLPGPGIATLPPSILADEATFAMRLNSRRRRERSADGYARWAWVSRCEPRQGAALAILGASRRQEQFEIFGTLDAGLKVLGLELPNIVHRGPAHDGKGIDFADYDGCVFESLPDEMTNVVLEAIQHAIPIVLADADDLRKTFEESAILFVRHGSTANDTAANISRSLDRLIGMTTDEITTMVTAARKQALSHPAIAKYKTRVARLFHPI